jgi:hypothetical protein
MCKPLHQADPFPAVWRRCGADLGPAARHSIAAAPPGTLRQAFDRARQTVLDDPRFEYLRERTIQDVLWRFVCEFQGARV